MTNKKLVTLGIGLVGLAVIPTPDDITIISPMAQLVIGTALIIVGTKK